MSGLGDNKRQNLLYIAEHIANCRQWFKDRLEFFNILQDRADWYSDKHIGFI